MSNNIIDYYNKYSKYKKKFLSLKCLSGGGDRSENVPLWSLDRLYDTYDNEYRFYDLYHKHPQTFKILMSYIYSKFGPFKKKIDADSLLSTKRSDADFYEELRKYYTNNVNEINNFRRKLYRTKQIDVKVNTIYDILKNNLKVFKCHKILDIGTEDIKYLDDLERVTGCTTIGLNIKSGYSHYNTYNEAVKSGKVVLYDGVDIPFKDNEFSLVTVITVLHHVKNIDYLVKEICRVGQNIYIRDNDMANDVTKNIVDIQHELYEGVLNPSERSPIYTTTNEQIIRLLKANGYQINYNKISKQFSKSYIVFASKINI